MFNVTREVSRYIREKGIRISAISRGTEIPDSRLYNSLSGKRPLRADEYIAICGFLEKDPKYFCKTA